MVSFSKKLKELRHQYRLTQKQLAEKIGVTDSVICYYEKQERIPSPEILLKLAKVFNVTTDYLLGNDTDQLINISDLDKEDIQYILNSIEMLRNKNKKTNSGMK